MLIFGRVSEGGPDMIFTVNRVLGPHRVEAIGHTGRMPIMIQLPTHGFARSGEPWCHVRLRNLGDDPRKTAKQIEASEIKGFISVLPWVRSESDDAPKPDARTGPGSIEQPHERRG